MKTKSLVLAGQEKEDIQLDILKSRFNFLHRHTEISAT